MNISYLQGLSYWRAESICLLLLEYEFQVLFEPTGGSPDVVHLIKYASQVSGTLLKASQELQPKVTIGQKWTILGHFCILWFPQNDLKSEIWHYVPFKWCIRQYKYQVKQILCSRLDIFNFQKKRMKINNHNASKMDKFQPPFKNRTLFSPSLFEHLKVNQKLGRHF